MWFFFALFLVSVGVPYMVRREIVYTPWGVEYRIINWQYYEPDLVVVFTATGFAFTLIGIAEVAAGLCACGTTLLADSLKDRKWWHYEFG